MHRDFHGDAFFHLFGIEIDHLVDDCLVLVEIVDECAQAALVAEGFLLAGALVPQGDGDAGIEKRQFAQLSGENVVLEFDVVESFFRRLEVAFGAGCRSISNHGKWRLGHTVFVILLPDLAFAPDGQFQFP